MKYEELVSEYDRVIADFGELARSSRGLQAQYPLLFGMMSGHFHGIQHWVRVALYGLAIARHLSKPESALSSGFFSKDALERAAVLAAFFHDCMRETEGVEPGHGRKAAEVFRSYSTKEGIDQAFTDAICQAFLFHEGHPSVDPAANEVTVCLCNADRLDRVRLGDRVMRTHMYPDGVWESLEPLSRRLLKEVDQKRVKTDLAL